MTAATARPTPVGRRGDRSEPGPGPTRWALALQGIRHMTPMALGVVPFGLAVGAQIASTTIGLGPALASGPIVLAGAAQLATLQMLEAGGSPIVIVASALLINLRLLLYGTTLAPWFAGAPLRQRLLLAVPVIDQLHLLCMGRFREGDLGLRDRVAYYAGPGAG